MGLFEAEPSRSAWVKAKTECEVAEVSYAKFRQLTREDADILFAVSAQIAGRLRATTRKVGDLAFLDVTGRVAGTLLDLCKQPDAMTHPDGMQIKVTRQEIGRIVGCSRKWWAGCSRTWKNRAWCPSRAKPWWCTAPADRLRAGYPDTTKSPPTRRRAVISAPKVPVAVLGRASIRTAKGAPVTASKPRHTRRHQAPALLCLIVMLAACGGGGGGDNAAGPVANQPDGPELPEPPAPRKPPGSIPTGTTASRPRHPGPRPGRVAGHRYPCAQRPFLGRLDLAPGQ